MEKVDISWNKNIEEAPYGLILIKIAVHSQNGEISGSEMALAYQMDGIKGDFYVDLPNNGYYEIHKSSILEWSKFEIITDL